MKIKVFKVLLNGEKELREIKAFSRDAAKGKLDFLYPNNFNIELRFDREEEF